MHSENESGSELFSIQCNVWISPADKKRPDVAYVCLLAQSALRDSRNCTTVMEKVAFMKPACIEQVTLTERECCGLFVHGPIQIDMQMYYTQMLVWHGRMPVHL